MLIELDNKVVKLKFFARELKKQEKKLLQSPEERKPRVHIVRGVRIIDKSGKQLTSAM